MTSTLELTKPALRSNFNSIASNDEQTNLRQALARLGNYDGQKVSAEVLDIIKQIRDKREFEPINSLLADYDLSSPEGVLLMRLAEALLRIPDSHTACELLIDKLGRGDWIAHAKRSKSPIAKVMSTALAATSALIASNKSDSQIISRLRQIAVKAARRAMRILGRTFVMAETIEQAVRHITKNSSDALFSPDTLFSFDMLGEAALTATDATKYFDSYMHAIEVIGQTTMLKSTSKSTAIPTHCHHNSGISIKLSALHPRFEEGQHNRIISEMTPTLTRLAEKAASLNLPLTVDAEESERLELSLDVIAAVMAKVDVNNWDGFGLAVQAYQARASGVIDEIANLAQKHRCRLMLRLVKGAYWDSEIKRAQEIGIKNYPVFSRKENTDVNYLACARQLFNYNTNIYPQFATHNAVSAIGVMQIARDGGFGANDFEFQRLHGMGEALHRVLGQKFKTISRVYAPVGSHKELLPYLVRRLLENGANSSFVNRIEDSSLSDEDLAVDNVTKAKTNKQARHPAIPLPPDVYGLARKNAIGFDVAVRPTIHYFASVLSESVSDQAVMPIIDDIDYPGHDQADIVNPAKRDHKLGIVHYGDEKCLELAINKAHSGAQRWAKCGGKTRAKILFDLADRLETDFATGFRLCVHEAGKTWQDAIAEIREAIDFCRYYGNDASNLLNPQPQNKGGGIIGAISPWNFPIAIFCGQIAGALAAGHAVIAKPAEQTNLCARWVVKHAYAAGVPTEILSFIPGKGEVIGAGLAATNAINGIVFTGSTAVANSINRSLAISAPSALLIAETGGINAMIVDSTALIEQAVRDIIASAFQSAGQRCSALRLLFVQEDVARPLYEMLCGAMDELVVANPADYNTDVGPVIDNEALKALQQHCDNMIAAGDLKHKINDNDGNGHFIAPHLFKLSDASKLKREVFGPILHSVTFSGNHIDKVVKAINDNGYGLTLGLETRIDSRAIRLANQINVGNAYVNRNQIGAIVGANPFGGEGLSGTGPKAGGPFYVSRITAC